MLVSASFYSPNHDPGLSVTKGRIYDLMLPDVQKHNAIIDDCGNLLKIQCYGRNSKNSRLVFGVKNGSENVFVTFTEVH